MTKIEAFELAIKFIKESNYVSPGTIDIEEILKLADRILIWSTQVPTRL